jgi:hypothetical protein
MSKKLKTLRWLFSGSERDHTLERKYGPKPALDHVSGSAFPGPNRSICFVYNFFELLDHGYLDQKIQVWTMAIRTRKTKFRPWSVWPEMPGLDHGHSDQESHIWTMVIRTLKARFGPWSFGSEKTGLDNGNSVLHVFFQSMRAKDNYIIQE